MIRPTDIHTLDSFRRKTKQHVERLQSTGRPEVLTVNGKPSVVVQDAAAYEQQMEKVQVIEALAESVKQADSGKVHDARKAVRRLIDELRDEMSYRIVITDRALDDLREIRDYIAVNSPDNAADFLKKILNKFDLVEKSPDSYPKAPEDDAVPYTLRQYILKPYRILYRVEGQTVQILHVRHGARRQASPDELA